MTQISNYLKKIKSYCDFYLEFDSTNKRYKFNQMFADEINCEFFESDIEQLKDKLYDILDDIKDQGSCVQRVISLLENNTSWYETEKISDFSLYNKFTTSIIKTEGIEIAKSKSITLNDLLKSPQELSHDSDEMFYYLITHKSKTDNYKDESDFEKVKLHYVLTKYFESILSFKQHLLNLHKEITIYGIKDYNRFRPIKKPNPRCVVNLTKIEMATFFDGLFQSNILYFDLKSDKKRDKAKYDFFNNNFSYVDRKNKIINVSYIQKEFGSIKKFANKTRQIEIIDSLIDQLDTIKEKFE